MLRNLHSRIVAAVGVPRSPATFDRLGIPNGICTDLEMVAALSIRIWVGGHHYYGTLCIGAESMDVRSACDAKRARLLSRDSMGDYRFKVGQESGRYYCEEDVLAAAVAMLPESVLVMVRGGCWDNPRKCEVLWTR